MGLEGERVGRQANLSRPLGWLEEREERKGRASHLDGLSKMDGSG